MTLKDWIILTLKGIGMGAANSVPGVSGGTIAFITGIYEKLVRSINNIDTKAVKYLMKGEFGKLWDHVNGNFLCAVMLGVLIAMFSFAKLIVWCMDFYPIHTWAFFFGLIIASGIIMLRSIKGWNAVNVVLLIAGAALGVFVCTLDGAPDADDDLSLFYVFCCGAVSICAMILPGVSGSLLLQVMGAYRQIMEAIAQCLTFDVGAIVELCVFGAGCVCGLLAFAKLLRWLMDKWENQTMIVLCGFVLGSLVKVWPWDGDNLGADALTGAAADPHILAGVLFIIVGITLVLGLEWLGKRSKK